MNEQDKRAYADAFWAYAEQKICREVDFEAGWQAALEYARGKQEPVAWMLMDGDVRDSFWLDLSDAYNLKTKPEHKFLPLYTTPPAQPVQPAVNEQMLEALRIAGGSIMEICKERYVPVPHSTMRRIDAAIAAAEAAKGSV